MDANFYYDRFMNDKDKTVRLYFYNTNLMNKDANGNGNNRLEDLDLWNEDLIDLGGGKYYFHILDDFINSESSLNYTVMSQFGNTQSLLQSISTALKDSNRQTYQQLALGLKAFDTVRDAYLDAQRESGKTGLVGFLENSMNAIKDFQLDRDTYDLYNNFAARRYKMDYLKVLDNVDIAMNPTQYTFRIFRYEDWARFKAIIPFLLPREFTQSPQGNAMENALKGASSTGGVSINTGNFNDRTDFDPSHDTYKQLEEENNQGATELDDATQLYYIRQGVYGEGDALFGTKFNATNTDMSGTLILEVGSEQEYHNLICTSINVNISHQTSYLTNYCSDIKSRTESDDDEVTYKTKEIVISPYTTIYDSNNYNDETNAGSYGISDTDFIYKDKNENGQMKLWKIYEQIYQDLLTRNGYNNQTLQRDYGTWCEARAIPVVDTERIKSKMVYKYTFRYKEKETKTKYKNVSNNPTYKSVITFPSMVTVTMELLPANVLMIGKVINEIRSYGKERE